MVILNSKKLIFIHIPKTGGDSISRALQKHMSWQDLILGGSQFGEKLVRIWGKEWEVQKHSTAAELKQLVGDATMGDYYYFAFVRHPLSRALSYYQWAKTIAEKHKEKQGWRYYARNIPIIGHRWDKNIYRWNAINTILKTNSFSEFIRHPNVHESIGFKAQYNFLYNEKGGQMVDFVGKLENIETDIEKISQTLGFDISLPHKNKSKGKKVEYNPEDQAYITKIFKIDYETFGYSY